MNTPAQDLSSDRASLMNADEVAKTVHADPDPDQGLTAQEAARRLAEQGPNELQSAPLRPAWRRPLAHFQDPLIYLLLGAVLVAQVTWIIEGAAGWPVDAAFIAAIVALIRVPGYAQKRRRRTRWLRSAE